MKFNLVRHATALSFGFAVWACAVDAQAGWGVLGGGSSGGGSTGYASVGGASSGGYAAAYGSSGGASSGGASSGGYAAAYSSVGGASSGGSSGGGPGLLQRVASRIHDHMAAKHARHAARRAAYGSSGGYASSGGSAGYGSSGGYTSYSSYGGGSSGGSAVSYGSSGGGVSYGSTGYSSGVSHGSTGGASYGSVGGTYYGVDNSSVNTGSLVSNVQTQDDAVYLTVAVPADAKLYVNDDLTSSTGAVRKFVSHGLKAGKQYRFVVRAELADAAGKLMTEEKTVVVSAGEQEQVQFAFAESSSKVETAITLNLPEGAKVLLAGNETKASGESRTFRTSRLKVGEFWDNYEIEVEYQGQVKRQAIRLVGGDSLQLTFNFDQDSENLAAR